MINQLLLLLCLICFSNPTKKESRIEYCQTGLYLNVNLKGVRIDKTPEYHIREGGMKVPVVCAVFVRKKDKEVSLTTIENYKHLQYKVIDSFNLTPQPNIKIQTFYNIKIMEKNFIQFNIHHKTTTINMVFERENLDFALQLINNLEITSDID